MSPMPSRWRGLPRRDPLQLVRRPAHDLVHLRLLGPERAADRDARRAGWRDDARRAARACPRRRHPARSSRRPGRRGRARPATRGSAQPAVRALGRALGVVAVDVERRALVERERDVGAERRLHLHRRLRRDEALAAVDVGAEAHALLLDREDRAGAVGAARRAALDLVGDRPVAHREDLEATGVGDDRPAPAHELVQPALLGDELVARRQEQMERVAEHHVVAERSDLARLDPFTTPFVASGTNAGVRTSPCASRRTPCARASRGRGGGWPAGRRSRRRTL